MNELFISTLDSVYIQLIKIYSLKIILICRYKTLVVADLASFNMKFD